MGVVLVVDDHVGVAGAVAQLVKLNGGQAATANSGPAALEFIRSAPVDLVVLDVSMPGMSGLDVLRSLAADGTVPGLPVVMYSASGVGREEAMRLGAIDFLVKGQCEDHLIDLVKQHADGDRHAPPAPVAVRHA